MEKKSNQAATDYQRHNTSTAPTFPWPNLDETAIPNQGNWFTKLSLI